MKKPILIYGAGGLGREILALIRALKDWEPVAFIDDQIKAGSTVSGLNVIGGLSKIMDNQDPINIIVAFGNPASKAALLGKMQKPNIFFPTLIHPSAILQQPENIQLGKGTVIAAGCILTTDIDLGDHVLVNLNTTIGHNTKIGSFSSIMPGVNIAGEVTVGESVLIGSGANIMNGISLGDRCKVGMGAVVLKSVDPGITVVGVPAKRIR